MSPAALSLLLAAACIAPLLLGWIGYPFALRLLARDVDRRRRPRAVAAPPRVSVVIATREPPAEVAARVADVRAADYPAAALEVVVALDRDAPAGDREYGAALPAGTRLVRGERAPGKAVALNAGVRAASGQLLVFTDSAQRFAPDAIRELVGFLSDRRFGAVSGHLRLPHDERADSLLARFWSYEVRLRSLETRVHSVVAVTGAIYAVRRELWPTLPPALICDDLYVPLAVARRGHRVGYWRRAVAVDPRSFTREQEIARKVRTLTGMLQLCAWQPWVLAPWRNPLWLQFACHKLVRVATPVLLLCAATALAVALAANGLLDRALRLAILGGGLALIALDLWRPVRARALRERAVTALQLFASPLLALRNALRRDWNVWRPVATLPRGRRS